MLIDIIFAIVLILGIVKGYQRGLIVGLFSFLAIIIGLAAALKLSAVVAGYIGRAVKVSEEWLPIISFFIVFIIVILLIRLGAKAIERTVEIAMMGWVNRLGGIIFYGAIYILAFSVILFYAEQMQWIKQEAIDKSVTYSFVRPWGPKVINAIGSVIPFFKDVFVELESFFDKVAGKIS